MLEHPLRIVNELINQDDKENDGKNDVVGEKEGGIDDNRSHDHPTTDTPPLTNLPSGDSVPESGDVVRCEGGEGGWSGDRCADGVKDDRSGKDTDSGTSSVEQKEKNE